MREEEGCEHIFFIRSGGEVDERTERITDRRSEHRWGQKNHHHLQELGLQLDDGVEELFWIFEDTGFAERIDIEALFYRAVR